MKAKRIAVTGGIGSGKSTLVEFIREAGYPCFSCDAIYRELRQSPEYIAQIKALFPSCVVEEKLDTQLLSSLVFTDGEKLKALNALSHPRIMQRLQEEMPNVTASLVFAEVPLLFEGGYEECFDGIIVVIRNKELRIEGLQKRDRSEKEEIARKFSAQFNYDGEEAKKQYQKDTVWIFENNGEKEELRKKMRVWLAKIDQT